jgi:hypothetical protein
LAYVELISILVTLIIPHQSSTITPTTTLTSSTLHLPLVQQSLSWSKDSFIDTLSASLTLLSTSHEKIYSNNSKYQLLIIFCQYLHSLFVDYENKSKILLLLLKKNLLNIEQREYYSSLLSTRSELGYVGGWILSHPSHSFLSIPSQYQTLTLIELFIYYNYHTIQNLSENVLSILIECEELLITESRRQHHIISPLIDQRLELAIRRVKFYCPRGGGGKEGGETVVTAPTTNTALTPSSRKSGVESTPKKMITSRRVSSAFTTFDNSMSDAFLTPEANRKREGGGGAARSSNPSVDLFSSSTGPTSHSKGSHHHAGLVDSMFRIPITPTFSLPIDVEKEFSAFSPYAHRLDGALILSGSAAGGGFSSSKQLSSDTSGCYICTSDLLGLIDDVLDAHLLVNPLTFQRLPSTIPSSVSQLIERSKLLSKTLDLRETRSWKQINGSSDLFTVLCCVMSCQPSTSDITVAVRIINSSGFKIPFFSVQLLLSSAEMYLEQQPSSSTFPGSGIKVSFDSNKTSSVLDGVEYFHMDGMVERVFTVHLHEFTNPFLHVRLIYRDLIAESDSIEIFTFPTTTAAAGTTATGLFATLSLPISLYLSLTFPLLSFF